MFSVQTTNIYVMCGPHTLLLRRSPEDESKPLWWESPAGHVDVPCEYLDTMTVRKEALRELFEETGICADPHLLEHLPALSSPRHMSYILYFKYVKPEVKLSDEHCEYMWLNVNTAPPQNTRYEVRRFLRDKFYA
jgi:8-oxo-dGTP pyrophosphatase MutT (NUDIX family)